MKVLHLNTYDRGGAATGAIRIHEALLENGVSSNILFYRMSTANIPNANSINITYPSLKQRLLKRVGISLTQFEKEIRKINKLGRPFSEGGTFELFSSPYSQEINLHNHPLVVDADIINLHWINGFIDLPSFISKINKPIVWTFHDMNPFLGGFHYDIDTYNNPQLKVLENQYKILKKKLFKNKKLAIIGNSNWTTQQAINSKQFEKAVLINKIYYPLNSKDFNIIDKTTAKTSLMLPLDKLIIGFACEDLKNPRKGFNIVLKALSLLSLEERKKICFLSFGRENKEIDNVQDLQIIQLGEINSSLIQSIAYSAMDFFVMPSLAEAFGLTSLEAMYCKTPVLGANMGGIPEMVVENKTGYLFEANNAQALKDTICKCINLSKEKIIDLGKNANEHVLNNHTVNKISNQYLKIYTQLYNDRPN